MEVTRNDGAFRLTWNLGNGMPAGNKLSKAARWKCSLIERKDTGDKKSRNDSVSHKSRIEGGSPLMRASLTFRQVVHIAS